MSRCGTWGIWLVVDLAVQDLKFILSSLNVPVILWSVVNMVLWYNKTRVNCVAWGDFAGVDGEKRWGTGAIHEQLLFWSSVTEQTVKQKHPGKLFESVISVSAKEQGKTQMPEAWLLSALSIIDEKRATSREKARSSAVVLEGVSPLVPAGPGSKCS